MNAPQENLRREVFGGDSIVYLSGKLEGKSDALFVGASGYRDNRRGLPNCRFCPGKVGRSLPVSDNGRIRLSHNSGTGFEHIGLHQIRCRILLRQTAAV